MDEAVAERIACSLSLLGSQAIAELMQETPRAVDGDEQVEGDEKRAEGLDEEGLHVPIILHGHINELSKASKENGIGKLGV